MSTVPANDPFNIDFQPGTRTPRPIPPPGYRYDGRRSEELSALYPAQVQEMTMTLGGSTLTADVTTLIITPLTTQRGSPWAQDLTPFTLTFTTGGTQTLAAVTAGLEADAVAQATVVDLADFSNAARIRDFMTVTSSPTAVIVTTRDAAATFSAVLSSTGSVTDAGQVFTGGTDDPLQVGTVVTRKAIAANGDQQLGEATTDGSETILGLLIASNKVAPMEPGDTFEKYNRGVDPLYAVYGAYTGFSDVPVAAGEQVYYYWQNNAAGSVLTNVNDADTTIWAGVFFLETTTAAGSAPVFIPHP